MTVEEIIDELESIESLLNNNELDVAKVDLYLLLKELLKTVTVEEDEEAIAGIEIRGC
jgi:hypothetical protein|tara:strand:+ start:361 stop:534 length:174 start_codon:yes stop_codon:yes gene_type:complete